MTAEGFSVALPALAMAMATQGRGVGTQTGRLKVPIEIPGRPLDFSEVGTMIPVVHEKVASMLSELAPDDVQLIPADIEGQPAPYVVVVATRLIRLGSTWVWIACALTRRR